MTCSRRPVTWMDRTKKETNRILRYGNRPLPNIFSDGKVHGGRVFPGGISSVLPWLPNILERNSIFMAAEWIYSFPIMKAKLRKALFAINMYPPVTGYTII